MTGHVEVWRYYDVRNQNQDGWEPWTWGCFDPHCSGQSKASDHDTHAEALAAALDHCATYPRKDQS